METAAGTSAVVWDSVTDRRPCVSLPKTVHVSLAQQETQAVMRSAVGGSLERKEVRKKTLSRRQAT